jgi:hypothetical protein
VIAGCAGCDSVRLQETAPGRGGKGRIGAWLITSADNTCEGAACIVG